MAEILFGLCMGLVVGAAWGTISMVIRFDRYGWHAIGWREILAVQTEIPAAIKRLYRATREKT